MNIREKAEKWIRHDPDAETRKALANVLEDEEELEKAFSGPLEFGTAGLRGEIGFGESRMNQAVVMRATSGLMSWLNSQVDRPRVVIGCDARHGSVKFAKAVAKVVSGAGGQALLLPFSQPTPLTAFSVKELNADAGIMVTASHNPKKDNGYKVYLGGRVATGEASGVQIVPPADKEIFECINAAPPADEIPLSDEVSDVDTRDAYQKAVSALGRAKKLKIVLTPMHGVGGEIALSVFKAAGFNDVVKVDSQWEPDPEFPTVAFPNPEEDGALDLAVEKANEVNADLIIAIDPDADRCAVAVPARQTPSAGMPLANGWVKLSGDETGALIGKYVAERVETGTLASSIVSSRLLGKIAEAHGLRHVTTLTGFKWIARVPDLVYGYEEAIGHCVDPDHVRDKDGVSAAVVIATIVSSLIDSGLDVLEFFDALAERYGIHKTFPLTFRVSDQSLITKAMQRLHQLGPSELADNPITEYVDLNGGYGETPGTDGVLIRTENDSRVVIRPSGTEPKLKCYLEVVLDPADGADWDKANVRLKKLSDATKKLCGM
ncbi:phospho-sugar mutase [Propionimicrobium lymphophilum]|uniref:phospho-sugar mutase n=1 Tax=Propionimicrobium lymphophilum TaxID=33012 RepID=UPI00040EF20B|nr:phospho-sugar mutase [Propionimicrobium lymphophilum]